MYESILASFQPIMCMCFVAGKILKHFSLCDKGAYKVRLSAGKIIINLKFRQAYIYGNAHKELSK